MATDEVAIEGSFRPSHAHEIRIQLPDLLDDARRWRHRFQVPADKRGVVTDLAEVERRDRFAADICYRLIVIHPFRGGNGRVTRGFLHLMLYEMGVLRPPERLFEYMAYRRRQYFAALHAGDAGDLKPFQDFVWRGVDDCLLESSIDEMRRSPLWPRINGWLKREQVRFLDRSRRDRFEDASDYKRRRALEQAFGRLLIRLGRDTASRLADSTPPNI